MKTNLANTSYIRTIMHLFIVRPLVSLFLGANAIGVEHISKHKQFIMISNHNSHIDVLLLFQVLRPEMIAKTRVVAAYEYFAKTPWVFRIVTLLFKPIWVNRNNKGNNDIAKMQDHLDNEGSIIIFPEGTRGQPDEFQAFKQGIGLLCKRYPDIPVVPVYLDGPGKSLPKNSFIPIPLLSFITVSPPQKLAGCRSDITQQLFNHLQKLAEEEKGYRHRRNEPREVPSYVAVIGIDGSGKSTLSRSLASQFPNTCCFIGDSLEFYNNGIRYNSQPFITDEIRKWISGRAKMAKKLSSYKFPKIAELLLRDHLLVEVDRWYQPKIIFMDGSPILNILAWSKLYYKNSFSADVIPQALALLSGANPPAALDQIFQQFPELLALCTLHLNNLRVPDITIFLDIDPEVCIERISSRGQQPQAHENIEQLTQLRKAYRLICKSLNSENKCNVTTIKGCLEQNQTLNHEIIYLQDILGENHAAN